MLRSLIVTRYFRTKEHRDPQSEELYSMPIVGYDSSGILEHVCRKFNQYRLENGPDSLKVYDTIQIQIDAPELNAVPPVGFPITERLFDNSSDISGAVIRYIKELQE